MLDRLDRMRERFHVGGQGSVQCHEILQESCVGDDLVADTGRFPHGNQPETSDGLLRGIIGIQDAHRIGVTFGSPLGGHALERAGLVVGGVKLHRAFRHAGAGGLNAARAGDEFPDAGSARNHLEHRALQRQFLVRGDRFERALIGGHDQDAAHRGDDAQRADHRGAGGSGLQGGGFAHAFFPLTWPNTLGCVTWSIRGASALPIRMAYMTPSVRPPK